MGLPVVAIEATCIPELVKDNVTGYLVPSNDVDALANGLKRLIENPSLVQEMGRNGRELVKKHALKHSLDQHESLYKKHILLRQSTHKQQAVRAERERLWRFTQ